MVTRSHKSLIRCITVVTLAVNLAMNSIAPVSVSAMPYAADAPGTLDSTFDGDGLVTTSIGAYNDAASAIALQPDGKILVAGVGKPDMSSTYEDFALLRYSADGSLDTSFDTDGIVTTDFANYPDFANDLALQSDGKIVVAGSSALNSSGSETSMAIARYNSDGSLDTSFDLDGKATTRLGPDADAFLAVAVQTDGKIVGVGVADYGIAVTRYNSDGSLDTTFGIGGIVITDISGGVQYGFSLGNSLALQSDGKIVVGAITGGRNTGVNLALLRYGSDGSLDTTFSDDGFLITDFTIDVGTRDNALIALQSDGKILLGGDTSDHLLLARYNVDGILDTSFGTDGLVMPSGGASVHDIALQRNGKIVVVKDADTGLDFTVLRFNPDGLADTTFGVNGVVLTDFGINQDDISTSVAIQPDGNIVVAGYRAVPYSNTDIALARYIGDDPRIIHRVKWDASGAHNGTSWTDAYTDLQSALAAASSGDEIWVAAGTYKPTTGTDRTASFVLKNGVAIYGGFQGTETQRNQRSNPPWLINTTLSGDIGVAGDNSDNSYHVVVGSNTDSSAVLDGFTITAGNADNDQKGGGMYNYKSSPTLANVIFSGNAATYGGGMYNGGEAGSPPDAPGIGSHPTLTNVTFKNNSARQGGGMENMDASHPSLINVTFNNNTALRSGGGMFNMDHSDPTLTDVTFSHNTAGNGGGIANLLSDPTLTNVTFDTNSAERGGGISNGYSDLTITNSAFVGNSATTYGGAVSNEYSSPSLTNVTMSDNSAVTYGGGIYNDANSSPSLRNVTVNGNTAGSYGGLYNPGPGTKIHNSILYGNSGDEIYATADVTYSIVEGGYSGTGNLSLDPQLGPLQDNSGHTFTMALGGNSPAIDAGEDANCPATDQRGMPRPQGSQCDIGAFEYRHVLRYVKWNASGANNGSSWTNAYTDLQSALSASLYGDEIWVAAGTYYPTSDVDRSISFVLQNGVAMYGGFSGTETSRDQRNFEMNLTVLSGDIGTSGDTSDNSYHVVFGGILNDAGVYAGDVTVLTNATILDGFTVTAGNANGALSYDQSDGGGIYNVQSHLTITNVIFTGNLADANGGGMYNIQSHPTLTNVTFQNNSAISRGGGFFNTFGGSKADMGTLIFTDVTFTGNSANVGGGIFATASNFALTNVIISENTAITSGGGIYNLQSTLNLTNVIISGNMAGTNGGGIYCSQSVPELTNVTISGNSAGINGGGIYCSQSAPELMNVTISGNSAASGAGIYNMQSDPTLINVTLRANSATLSGGGIYNQSSSNPIIRNSILWENSAPNGAQINIAGSRTPVVSDSVVQGGYAGGTNIITTDPLLGPLDNYGGFTETIPLQTGSSAIDRGNTSYCPATDQRGVTRPQDGDGNGSAICDIGAYEVEPDTTLPTISSIVRVDADPASATSVDFTVTFSEPVSGVETGDFTLNATGGISGATISAVTPQTACAGNTYCDTYEVTVGTGTGNGTLRLDVPIGASIADAAGNSLADLPFEEGEFYTVEKALVYGVGKYDDAHEGWSYSGFVATTTTGPYLGTMHYSKVVGSEAEFLIEGSQIVLTYSKYSNRGKLEVYLDDNPDPIAVINEYNATRIWQASWTSENLGAGEHTVRLVHTSGAQVDIDAMEVKEYELPGLGKHDDTHADWTYSGFIATTTTGPYLGTMHYSKVIGNTAEFTFEGSQIVLTYSKYSNRGTLAVYLDDDPNPIAVINEYNATRVWQASWTSGNLGAGEHTVRLVHASGAQVDIDAMEVKEYVNPGPGKYDDVHAGWTYNGFVATTTTGPYKGTMHYSKVIGDSAEFTFEGSQITLLYSKYSNRGSLEVYIDDNPDPIATIDQYNGTRIWQASWTSEDLGAGEHTVRLVHASGAQVDIDALTVQGP